MNKLLKNYEDSLQNVTSEPNSISKKMIESLKNAGFFNNQASIFT